MKRHWRLAAFVLALSTALTPALSEAKRLGGGGSVGLQRSVPSRTTPAQTPPPSPAQGAQPAQNQAAPASPMGAGAAQAAGKRSWMGPIAGLAAGLGLAALMSHFGLGEAFSNFLMMALLAMVALFAFSWIMRRMKGRSAQPATAAAGSGNAQRSAHSVSWPAQTPAAFPGQAGSAAASFAPDAVSDAASIANLPADFDRPGFERIARTIFIRLQAANDRGDLNDLREFTTPEMFGALRVDLQDRGQQAQTTDVVEVRADVFRFDRESERDVVSVRFQGLIREDTGSQATPFDEVWHLIRPRQGETSWRIAGIQQLDA